MIQPLIHQIWVGNKKRPKQWMDTWKNSDMDYALWTEKEIDGFELKNRDKYDFYMAVKDYAGAADVARVEIVHEYGGVFMDADSVRLKPIEELLEKTDFLAGIEYDDRIANGIIGATKGHPILAEYIRRIGTATVIEPPCYTIGGTMLTSCVDWYGRNKTTIMPQWSFYPKWKHRGAVKGTIYARQMWGSTKGLYE